MKPGDGQPSSRPTRAYLSSDDKSIYAIFDCESVLPNSELFDLEKTNRPAVFREVQLPVALLTGPLSAVSSYAERLDVLGEVFQGLGTDQNQPSKRLLQDES